MLLLLKQPLFSDGEQGRPRKPPSFARAHVHCRGTKFNIVAYMANLAGLHSYLCSLLWL